MIIFSQWPTSHSRLANSLIWMSRTFNYLSAIKEEGHFQWAIERFTNYLEKDSYWLKPLSADFKIYFFKKTGEQFSSRALGYHARKIEERYEFENSIESHSWNSIFLEDPNRECLYLSGKIDLTEPNIIKSIKEHKFTICHEPFNYVFNFNKSLLNIDFSNIKPSNELFINQLNYVNSIIKNRYAIGLHIRRGDYNKYLNGKYFFDDDVWFCEAKKLIDQGNFVWIFSNDLNDKLRVALISIGAHVDDLSEFEIDFVRMMHMRELRGPPSTFSGFSTVIANNCYGYSINCSELIL
jgi:hypothetical protein